MDSRDEEREALDCCGGQPRLECKPAAEITGGEDMLGGESAELGESINFPIPERLKGKGWITSACYHYGWIMNLASQLNIKKMASLIGLKINSLRAF